MEVNICKGKFSWISYPEGESLESDYPSYEE